MWFLRLSEILGFYEMREPRHTLEVVVIGYTEGIDERSGMLHDLLLAG
jgi:hypothetical protein